VKDNYCRNLVDWCWKLAILGILTFLTVACRNDNSAKKSPSTNCQSVEHASGTTEICNQPQKIIAIGPNMLELLLALGIQPVGYADYFSLPASKFDRPSRQILFLGERVTNQPVNIGSADDPSLETIAQLQPNLILGDTYANQDEYDLLSQIAPTLLFTYAVDDQWQKQIRAIAQAVGKSEQAERVIQEHFQRITQTKQALQPIVDKSPRVLLLGSEKLDQGVEIDPYNHDSYCSALLADLGFQIVFPPNGEGKEGQGGKVSLEMLPQLAADLIIVQGYNSDFSKTKQDLVESQIAAVKQQWHNNAITQSLPASQSEDASASPSERIYFTSAYLCRAMPGPIGAEIFLKRFQEQLLKSK
jgi:iron complex transport system substrate-binding protein